MNELTLTGATLLSDSASLSSSAVATVIGTAGGGVSAHSNCSHSHYGSASGGDGVGGLSSSQQSSNHILVQHHAPPSFQQKPCCSNHHTAPAMIRPTVTLQIPAFELVQKEDNLIFATLHQLVRMGRYELFQEIVTAYQEYHHQQNQPSAAAASKSNNNNSAAAAATIAVNKLLCMWDEKGYSLLHWAVKRTDDVRFVQQLLPINTLPAVDNGVYHHVVSRDDTAMTPLHWACTEEKALPIIRLLLKHDALTRNQLLQSSSSSAAGQKQQQPKNPALTTPLLERGDSTGCTPLLIAAQHGHVETVAYLILVGANRGAMDTSRDTATHWAAYKGSLSVLGLLSFYDPDCVWLQTRDAYGQTPLHLAALRGHARVCRYILTQLSKNGSKDDKKVLFWKDKNGRTPYTLATHKDQPTVAHVLQQRMEVYTQDTKTNWKRAVQRIGRDLVSKQAWMLWMGLPVQSNAANTYHDDLDISPQLPCQYVQLHCVLMLIYYFTVFVPIFHRDQGILWDWMVFHIIMMILYVVCVYFLYKVRTSNPGRLDSHHPDIGKWQRLYEITLQALAEENETKQNSNGDDSNDNDKNNSSTSWTPTPNSLCHSCHIARPPRAKHDRFTHSCILLFDHHCPFVGNSVGLENYRYFYFFCMTMSLYFIGFWILLAVYYFKTSAAAAESTSPNAKAPMLTVLYGVFLGIHCMMPMGMWMYHSQLIALNLTTNEQINVRKYPYFWRKQQETTTTIQQHENGITDASFDLPPAKRFHNPWNHGVVQNFVNRLLQPPGPAHYLVMEEQVGLLAAGTGGGQQYAQNNNSLTLPFPQEDMIHHGSNNNNNNRIGNNNSSIISSNGVSGAGSASNYALRGRHRETFV